MASYDEALRLMDGKNPDIFTVRLLLEAAISDGDDRAEYALATWYLHGEHVPINLLKGVDLLKRATDKGNIEAAFDLGICYERGKGVPKSETMAFKFYQMAADGGDHDAMQEVGRMLYYGIGVPKDREAADIWLAKAEGDTEQTEGDAL